MLLIPVLTLAPTLVLAGDQAAVGYKLPPPAVVRLVDAPATPQVSVSSDGEWLLFQERPAQPSIEDVLRPWIPLAGMRIDPQLNAGQQLSFVTGLEARKLGAERGTRIELPSGARVIDVRWSHRTPRLALTLATETGVELWIADGGTGVARRLARGINGLHGAGFDWLGDGVRLLVWLTPEGRGAAPVAKAKPVGPAVQETSGSKTALRTYQDLLTDAHDEALFEYYATSQLAILDPRTDQLTKIGPPAIYPGAEFSPDDKHLLVTRSVRPFSYLLPAGLFPHKIEVWGLDGKLERLVADVPMGENIPQEGVRTGPRSVQWHPVEDATLVWCEALDGGDPKTKAAERDRWRMLSAPFAGEARELRRMEHRAQGISFFPDGSRIVFGEYDRDKRWTRTFLYPAPGVEAKQVVWDDRNTNDRYGDPGQVAMVTNARGRRVVRLDGTQGYRSGRGSGPEGERPFLDRFDTLTLAKERLWQCETGVYESLVAIARTGAQPVIVTSRETPRDAPNYLLRELGSTKQTALTNFPDPQPELRGVTQELVKYKRADGVDLSATLYLPPGYKAGTRLPLFVWAYPQEFTDASTAGQVSGSPNRFVRLRGASHLYLLMHGYAVLDNAAMPVVGDPETMNDTFIEQIVAASQAAIDFCVERGVADRERVAVGGHSYGAFMTANLLAHCDLFKAGVARSGAYNRTLTPFGFQSERRTIWEAPNSYIQLSPFLSAHKVNEPLLMIHGEKDNNMGTFPIQSERMYAAVKGNGGTARLVMLPGESHGYSARESVLHTIAETFEWLDRHVKNARIESKAGAVEAGAAPTGGK